MSDNVFKLIQVVGTSKIGVGEAVQNAISRAAKTMKNIGWVETSQIRGSVSDGKITEFQAEVRIGFRLED